jgi:hypothetical protein
MRQRLFDLGVARILDKPVSLQALLDCVRQVSATPTAEETSPHDPEAAAIERHFGGQHSLFVDFRAASRQQFAVDLEQGDAMMAGDDVQSLRRLAHSLKTVMRLLGRSDAAVRAAALEHAAQQPGATMVSLQDAWQRLRQDLL